MSEIREKLAKTNDGRNHALGETSRKGYLGGLGELPIEKTRPVWEKHPRLPEKDTERCYAYASGAGRYSLVPKERVDKARKA